MQKRIEDDSQQEIDLRRAGAGTEACQDTDPNEDYGKGKSVMEEEGDAREEGMFFDMDLREVGFEPFLEFDR